MITRQWHKYCRFITGDWKSKFVIVIKLWAESQGIVVWISGRCQRFYTYAKCTVTFEKYLYRSAVHLVPSSSS